MATEIGVWQISNGGLEEIEISMVEAGKKEVDDLENWLKNCPMILGQDILIIGEQTQTKSGPMDFLGIDQYGNLVVIELKRGMLPRESLTQAIDYASDVASWDVDNISEECLKYTGQSLEDYLNENFEDVDLEDLIINKTQRILLVGFSVEESLQRMIEWLSSNYSVSINAIVLKYIQTKSGDELIARTMIISEETENERIIKKRFQIPMSDDPGNYGEDELKSLLRNYLLENRTTPRRIRTILLPLCLKSNVVTRDNIKKEMIKNNEAQDENKAGLILTTISRELGIKKRDYLRQIIQYERPNPWEKDNYQLAEEYKEMVKALLDDLDQQNPLVIALDE